MLETEVLDAAAERNEPVVMLEMFGAVDRARFIDEIRVELHEIVGRLLRPLAVAGEIDEMRKRTRRARKRDAFQQRAGEHRRIDETRERDRREMNLVAVLRCAFQSGRILPSARQFE